MKHKKILILETNNCDTTKGKIIVKWNFHFGAMQYENVNPIVYVNPVHVKTLTHVHVQAEDLDYMEEK